MLAKYEGGLQLGDKEGGGRCLSKSLLGILDKVQLHLGVVMVMMMVKQGNFYRWNLI